MWWTVSISNAKFNRKRIQIAEISFPIKKSGQTIEFRCQNFYQKLINSRFCARAVKIWLKRPINAAKLSKLTKFKAINRKSWSPRTIVVIDLSPFKAYVILRMRR